MYATKEKECQKYIPQQWKRKMKIVWNGAASNEISSKRTLIVSLTVERHSSRRRRV